MAAVLVVDDDRDIRELIVFRLEQAGIDVLAAANGVDGLALARDVVPDVAVLDVMMPGLSGLDVARALRADPHTSAMGIVLLTARVQEADISITKPFNLRLLVNRIEALLARQMR